MKEVWIHGVRIVTGENAADNWEIIDRARACNPSFWWVHLSKFPSGHVVIEHEDVPDSLLNIAGQICLNNTKYRAMRTAKVSCTRLSNIQKGEEVGEVYFRSNRKVRELLIMNV